MTPKPDVERPDLMIDYVVSPSRVAEIVLNNPRKLNALDESALHQFNQVLDQVEEDISKDKIGAVLLRGEGKGFCAGRDISGLDPATDDAEGYLSSIVTPLLRRIDSLAVPTFAVVHGVCLGVGLGLVIACDIAYVAENARFGSPFAALGATLDSGGHYLFVERLGAHRALDLIITGDLITGEEAVRAGLFSRALPAEELVEFSRSKAEKAAAGAPLAAHASQLLVREIRDHRRGLWESIAEENTAQGELCRSADYAEGFAAFQEKRPPRFQGHRQPTQNGETR
ncbi:enoyl-CoA hydratase/isomerase family protein [Corynebacterium poyangense]|uniref:enoyl-CoA hydratase/isomerase family protein n=1 Tax=Corynebacterium poyangense TaxID=2684405 RepID=UPI0037BF6588